MRGRFLMALAVALGGCGDSHVSPDSGDEARPDVDALDPDSAEVAETLDTDTPDDTSPDVVDTGEEVDADVVLPPPRAIGERRARTSRCDDTDRTRCLLPWPSSAFLTPAASATGVRIELAADVLLEDDGLDAVVGDGFSRITPIVLALPKGLAASDVDVRLLLAEADGFGSEAIVETRVVFGRNPNDPDTLVAYPRAPLRASSEYLAVVSAVGDTATRWPASRPTELALGARPADEGEAAVVAYHAPARALLAQTQLDATRVVRMWDFVTRSADDPRGGLRLLAANARAAVLSGAADIAITRARVGSGPIAVVVEGTIAGLPEGETTFAVPFRVVVPSGAGDYRFVLYSHGTSGNVSDTAFDELIAGSGAAKVNVEIDGWTDTALPGSISGLLIPIAGSRHIVGKMRRAFAGIAAIHVAIEGPLGDLLGATRIGDLDNPAAGRFPRLGPPTWAGGSLGGVVGAVYAQMEPSVVGGVLNVPGAGFTHWLAQSSFTELLDLALAARYPTMADQQIVAAMAQSVWDEVDGAIWADARVTPPVFLVQRSVGDPVMPAVGTAMLARALDAVMTLPETASPIDGLDGLERAEQVVGRSAYTEFKTDETSPTAVHGFAASSSPAGVAARAQIEAFMRSLWEGTPTVTIPAACYEDDRRGVCDFSR